MPVGFDKLEAKLEYVAAAELALVGEDVGARLEARDWCRAVSSCSPPPPPLRFPFPVLRELMGEDVALCDDGTVGAEDMGGGAGAAAGGVLYKFERLFMPAVTMAELTLWFQ